MFFFFKQKTAYEIYQCDWSSDVCSSDLELKKHNVIIDQGPVKRGDGESIYFNDPDHNHLEIHCDH